MFGPDPIAAAFRRAFLTVGLISIGLAIATQESRAQGPPKTNVDVLGDLAIKCVGRVPDTLSSFLLEASDRMPYLRPRLTNYWRDLGKSVFLADSLTGVAPPADLDRMGYDPEDAEVSYTSADDAQLLRTISLSIRYSLIAPTGLLRDEGRCSDQYSDTINRGIVSLVERDPFPETRGAVPPQRSWRTWAEPVVLAASVGVVAYLFFTIRSS